VFDKTKMITRRKFLKWLFSFPFINLTVASSILPKIENIEYIPHLKIEKNQKVILREKTFIIGGDIIVRNGAELIVENAELKFTETGGIIVENGLFKARNSKFLPFGIKGWKNISIVGDSIAVVTNCFFKNPIGDRKGYEVPKGVCKHIRSENVYGGIFLICNDSNGQVTIENSVFEDCWAIFGGAIYAEGNINVKNCRFCGCTSYVAGGAICGFGSIVVENSEFTNCLVGQNAKFLACTDKICALYNILLDDLMKREFEIDEGFENSFSGGAIYAEGKPVIQNCSFISCSAYEGIGGAIFAISAIIRNCAISYCSAVSDSGGIYAIKSTIEKCSFEECVAHYSGAVSVENSELTNCNFKSCESRYLGGAIMATNSKVNNCYFENCYSKKGGAVLAEENSQVVKCIFKECDAYYGGGVYLSSGTIEDCRFDRCEAYIDGGGIYCDEESDKAKKIIKCKFSNCRPNNCGRSCKC